MKTPILGLVENMDEAMVTNKFNHYRDTERAATKKILDGVTLDLGRKVNALDKKRVEEFEEIKKIEAKDLQAAQKEYQRALREAKSNLDRDNARVKKEHDARRAGSLDYFEKQVAPINEEMKKTQAETTSAYAGKMSAAIVELRPLVQGRSRTRRASGRGARRRPRTKPQTKHATEAN